MRKIMIKLCDFLEKILYNEPTYCELLQTLDETRYRLFEADSKIEHLRAIIKKITKNN